MSDSWTRELYTLTYPELVVRSRDIGRYNTQYIHMVRHEIDRRNRRIFLMDAEEKIRSWSRLHPRGRLLDK